MNDEEQKQHYNLINNTFKGFYPKLKGVDFGKIQLNHKKCIYPSEYFANDINGDWWSLSSKSEVFIFKAFSKEKIDSCIKLLLSKNEINFDNNIDISNIYPDELVKPFMITKMIKNGIEKAASYAKKIIDSRKPVCWKGEGFKITHYVIEEVDIIIISN